jgi:CRP/FNR family transcriptional regulator, cyclic AMP receptor protein
VSDFLERLEPADREKLLALAQKRTYAPQEELIVEDEPTTKLIILRSGIGRVTKNHLGARVPLRHVGPGEVLGELSFVDAHPASAGVVAQEQIEAEVLDGAELRGLLTSDQALGLHVYRALSITLAERLRSSSEAAASVPILGIA